MVMLMGAAAMLLGAFIIACGDTTLGLLALVAGFALVGLEGQGRHGR